MNIIFSNLRVLIAERNLTIKKINEETNLSRTTISNLIHNNANGIQYDTLKQLCEFLNCDVGDIIKFAKLEVDSFTLKEENLNIPPQHEEGIEWYKEKDFHLNVHLFTNDRNLMTAAMIKVQEGYRDIDKNKIIQGIFFEDKLQKSITRTFGNVILTDAFLEEIIKRIVLNLKDHGFHPHDSMITYSPIVYR